MNEQKPLLVVIAGPMGAGKTTFYEAHLREAFPTLVPPVPHQREAILREHRSFAVEDLSYRQSRKSLPNARKPADDVRVNDNTADGKGHRLVARFLAGELVKMTHSSPDWLKRLFGRELCGHS